MKKELWHRMHLIEANKTFRSCSYVIYRPDKSRFGFANLPSRYSIKKIVECAKENIDEYMDHPELYE